MLSSCCCSACFAPKHDIGLLLPQIHQHLLGCGGEGNDFMAGRDKQKLVPLVPLASLFLLCRVLGKRPRVQKGSF